MEISITDSKKQQQFDKQNKFPSSEIGKQSNLWKSFEMGSEHLGITFGFS